MADDTTRIINLTEATEISDGMYLVTDASTGTRKLSLQKVLDKTGENAADEYSSSSTYSVGDFCTYNGILYECTTAITTAEAWTAGHWEQVTIGDKIIALRNDIEGIDAELETKADQDGTYPHLIAGNLDTDIYSTNDSPYIYRPTPADSDRERVKRIEGLSVGWNQLVQNGNFANGTTGWDGGNSTISAENNILTLTGVSDTTPDVHQGVPAYIGHKYLVVAQIKPSETPNAIVLQTSFAIAIRIENLESGKWTQMSGIVSGTIESSNVRVYANYNGQNTGKITQIKEFMLIDLTLLFGSTIADHIYTLEQATAGSGVAWVKQYIDLDSYHAYSQPTIKSVEGLEAHVMRDADDNIIGNYPLDSTITLRGIGKLVDGKLVADGDWYEPSGALTVRYAERAYQSGDESLADAITDGTTTVYKLTTPTTSTASPYQELQICDGNGTEEFVTDSPVPVGTVTEYPADLKKQVEDIYGIPPVPTEDGEYTLHATVASGVKTFTWVSES